MAVLTRLAVYQLARAVGLSQFDAATAGAVCDAESGRNTQAVGFNRVGPVITSRDRGLWQINDVFHPDVSDACAFDPGCNARAMARISSGGSNWHPWTTFNTGAFRQFLPAYLQIAGFAVVVGPAPYDPVSDLAAQIRQGRNLFAAVMQTAERVVDRVRAAAFADPAGGTSMGSGWYG